MSLPIEIGGKPALRFLFLEDSATYAALVAEQVHTALGRQHEIEHVGTLEAAIDAIGRETFDLILLDLYLPDSNGIQTLEKVHAAAPPTPIVILSSDDSEELAVAAVRAGAEDYLVKGTAARIHLIRTLCFALERIRKSARSQHEPHHEPRTDAQHEVYARKIQESLLPTHPPVLDDFEISGTLLPAGNGGDYYDYFIPWIAAGEGTVGIAVGDVTGSGLERALIMAEARACLHSLSYHETNLAAVLQRTNHVLCRGGHSHGVTMLLGHLNTADRCFHYAAAGLEGHHLPHHGQAAILHAAGNPLGIALSADYQSPPPVLLDEGDILLLATDGIHQARSPSREIFGTQRMLEIIMQSRNRTAAQIVEELHDAVREFIADQPPQDDMTTVIVKTIVKS